MWLEIIGKIYWAIGNGRLVYFWEDVLLHQVGPLCDFGLNTMHHDRNLCVCDVVTESGTWDWDFLATLVPQHVLDHIASIVPPSIEAGHDRLAWK